MNKLLIFTAAAALGICATIGVITLAQNQTGEDILETLRVAHGKDTLNKLKSIRTTSTVTFYNSDNAAFGKAQQVTSIDFKSRSIKAETYQQGKLANVVLVTSKGAWAWSIGGKRSTIPADQANRLRLASMFGPYGLRSDASEKRTQKRLAKKKMNVNAGTGSTVTKDDPANSGNARTTPAPALGTTVDGDELELESSEGEAMRVVVNPSTNLVAEQSFNSFDGKPQTFEFADYRLVDGLKVPFETRLSHDGRVTAIERVELVKVNLPMNAKDFELPN